MENDATQTAPRPLIVLASLGMLLSAGLVVAGPGMLSEDATASPARQPAEAAPGEALRFEANQGQRPDGVSFSARAPGFTVDVLDAGARLSVTDDEGDAATVEMGFVGAEPAREPVGRERLPGVSHYLTTEDPDAWVTDVPAYQQVHVPELYPGIDLVYYTAADGHLEYDFVLDPDTSAEPIRLTYDGVDAVTLTEEGGLELETSAGTLDQGAPVAYQPTADGRASVEASYRLVDETTLALDVGEHDPTRPVVIDPKIQTSTYHGGSHHDRAHGVAVDAVGNVYVTGETASRDLPTRSAYQSERANSWDAFVSKFDPSGDLVYSTYLGGSNRDHAQGIGVDADGRAVIAGSTSSDDLPTVNAVQSQRADDWDAFVAKLDASGSSLVYSTYLGGSLEDRGLDVAVDASGNAYATGTAWSADYPTTSGAFQPDRSARFFDAVVTKLDPTGGLAYSTYYGGSSEERGQAIAVDANGQAAITGFTRSTNLPLEQPVQDSHQGGASEAFVARFTADGSALEHATYLGGDDREEGDSVAFDDAGRLWAGFHVRSRDFPTTEDAIATNRRGPYVVGFSQDGASLAFSTTLPGGHKGSGVQGLAVDGDGDVHMAGRAGGNLFEVRQIQRGKAGGSDAYVAEIDPAAGEVLFTSYVGGSQHDRAWDLALTPGGDRIVVGQTSSEDFPTVDARQPESGGNDDAFVTRLVRCTGQPVTTFEIAGTSGDQAWWRSPVTVSFHVETPCPVGVTHSRVDGGNLVEAQQRDIETDGVHTMTYRSTDASDDATEESVKSAKIKVDQTPPTTSSQLDGLRGNAGWWRSDVTVALAPSDATSGVETTRYRVDGGAWQTGTSLVLDTDGIHTVEYQSEDVAGNTEPLQTRTVRIDATPPEVEMTRPQAGNAYVFDDQDPLEPALPATVIVGDVSVETNASDATSGIRHVDLIVDDGLEERADEPPYGFVWHAGQEAAGNHSIALVAADVAGNTAATSGLNVTTAPTSFTGLQATVEKVPDPEAS